MKSPRFESVTFTRSPLRGHPAIALAILVCGLGAGCAAPSADQRPRTAGTAPAPRGPVSRAELDDAIARLKTRPVAAPETVTVRFWLPKGERWSLLREDGGVICELPCTQRIEPERRLTLRRGDGAELAMPELLVSPEATVDVKPRAGRGSPLGALVVGAVGLNALAFGGIMTLGFCRESRNNASYSPGACSASAVVGVAGAATLIGAIAWGMYSRRPRVRVTTVPE